ncbi:MAG: hypothetical protein KF859_00495 [Phycisphaeraceae bacterium]|nr:hypothetical protein [Phycisphaeraceae bacterium]
MTHSSPASQYERRAFMRRLSIYLFGVAIGLIFLGIVQHLKQQNRPQQPQQVQQAPSAP